MTAHRCPVSRVLLLAVALSFISALQAVAQQPIPPAGPLTVEDAVAYALAHNPTLVRAEQDVQIAQTQVRVARAGAYPDVNVSINTTETPNPLSTTFGGQTIQLGSQLSSSGQLTVSQPVWPQTRWQAPVASAQANVGITQETLVRTRQQVMYQTRQAFYQVLSSGELVQVAQQAVDVAQQQLKLAQNTVNAGLAAPLDIYQAKAVLANNQLTLVQAKNTNDVAKAVLAEQLGLPAGTPVALNAPKDMPTAPPDVDALVADALKNRPELSLYNFRRKQIRAQMDIIRLQQLPILTAQAGYAQPLTGASMFSSSGLTFGAVIAWNLFDGGGTKAQLQAAHIQLAEVDTSARQTELQVTLEVRQAWLSLQNAQQQLKSAEEQRAAAAEALRIAQVRYENGEGIVLEVQQAQLNLTQALTALAQARFQAQSASAQLAFALGAPAPAVPLASPLPAPLVAPASAYTGR